MLHISSFFYFPSDKEIQVSKSMLFLLFSDLTSQLVMHSVY